MSSESERDGAAVRFPPPFVPLIALGVGLLAGWALGPLGPPIQGVARFGLGVMLVGAGLGCMFAAIGLFRRTGQDPTPWKSSPELISSGIYRRTRNPMYFGMGLVQAGLGVLFANLWIVALVPFTWLTIYLIAIRHEEAYLLEKFGDAYREYMTRVRRWI